MANYANLLATIAANIYTNHNNEVTAAMVEAALTSMVASLGDGYQFAGVATPATDPATPDAQLFFLAGSPGTYTDFLDSNSDPIEVSDGELAFIFGSGSVWSKAGIRFTAQSDIAFTEAGYIHVSTGEFVSLAGYHATDFIRVTPGERYIFYGSAGLIAACVALYSGRSDSDFVSAVLPGLDNNEAYPGIDFIIPDGVFYLRACHRDSDATSYLKIAPVTDGVTGAKMLANFFIKTDGGLSMYSSYYGSELVAVNPGDTYYYQGRSGVIALAVAGYDSDGQFVSSILGVSQTFDSPHAFTIPSGVYFIRACSSVPFVLIKQSPLFPTAANPGVLVNEYYGKVINWLGDSIVAGPDFDEMVSSYFGMTENDYGINGSTIAEDGGDTRDSMAVRFANMDDDADVIVVSGGTNDYQYAFTPFGTLGDSTTGTFYGALDVLCRGLVAKYPDKIVFFTTPIKRNQNADGTGHRTLDTDQDVANSLGKYLADYAAAIKEVCAKYSIPVCDLYAESYLNPNITEQAAYFDNVGTHPDDTGRLIMARRVRGFMKQLC